MSCVEVRNVFMSYGNGVREERILNGINMSVAKGTIYTLIGASGCGKTTLLSCLMGVQKPRSGELKVFNRKSTQVSKLIGFMPQQNSLVAELTIGETLQFFARLYEMDQDTFFERFDMLSKLLELPREGLQIRHLSGGQQRRVSLAATIIHDPKLLILDEPTVGLDFLLRERIWDFLVEKTAKDGLTTIITTHYISEAAHAHRCGFMRNGVLIAENAPSVILRQLRVESLDEAFYELCTKDSEMSEVILSDIEAVDDCCDKSEEVEIEESGMGVRFKVLVGLLIKEFHRMKRQPLEIFLIFILPIVQIVIFNNCIGLMPSALKVGVISDENHQCASQALNRSTSSDNCTNTAFSCAFINQMNKDTLVTSSYDSRQHALDDFRDSKIFGFVEIPGNFSQIVASKAKKRHGEVSVLLDNSKFHILFYAKAKMLGAFFDFIDVMGKRCSVNELLRVRPIKVEELYGSMDFDLRRSMMTAIVINTPFTLTNVFALLIISDTRIAGVWNRTILCGVKLTEIILTNMIECLLISLVLACSMMAGLEVYGIAIVGSSALVFAFIVEIAVVGFMLGFLISILFDKFQASSGVGQMILVLSVFTTGIFWPIESLSPWLKPLSYAHPMTFVIIAVRNVILKGHDICSPNVIVGLAVVNFWIVFLSMLSYIALTMRKFSKV